MTAHHALVLNLHQPPNNLQELLDDGNWEAKEILYALDRIPRSLWDLEDVARVHLSLSGTLLETLNDPGFQQRVYGVVDCGALLWHFQNQALFEILGTGFYHPVLPLIPEADRPQHLYRWLDIARHLLWRPHFQGFWPPEMGFSMELIPLLRSCGYRYVLVDSEHVEPVTSMNWQELRYRPHIARHGQDEIIIIVRDRDLSNAQEAGMDVDWFDNEIAERTRWCDFVPLVTTCTDGENGGWFRNPTQGANFWSAFYRPFLERVRAGESAVSPIFIGDYLNTHGAHGEVHVHTGAWNTGWHDGRNFTQWTGSERQRATLEALGKLSAAIQAASHQAAERGIADDAGFQQALEQATWRLLRAETSCNFYWGEAWVHRSDVDMAASWEALQQVQARLG
ncbi:MAG: glycoside hydrolase family 57 [Candidatus Thiosymbion ectosymbiont of Robbea hypermnestra]|nr:glycoside hydrolase family 57 [Candidatus Thiosymbion ectosymbiont of Robbea hypermnestra]